MNNEKWPCDKERLIRYKGIKHNVLNDAPFIGAIVIANSCHRGCKRCINGHLKCGVDVSVDKAAIIVQKIKCDPLNEGVIFSGLEWSEQPDDLVTLVCCALNQGLRVMVYTHHNEIDFFKRLPRLKDMPIGIKFGFYDVNNLSDNYFSHGIKLASTNQYIKFF